MMNSLPRRVRYSKITQRCLLSTGYDTHRTFEYRMLKVKILATLNKKQKLNICTSYTGHVSSYEIYHKFNFQEDENELHKTAGNIVDKISECIYDYPDKFISLFTYIYDEENELDKLDSIYIVRLPQNYYARGGPIRLKEEICFPYPW